MKIPKVTTLPSGKYFVRLRLGGKEYAKTFATQKEAESWALSIKAQHKAGQLKSRLPDEEKTIRQLMEEYVASSQLTEGTIKNFRSTENHHFKQIMDKPYNTIKNWQKVVNLELAQYNPNHVALRFSMVKSAIAFHGLEVPQVKIPKKQSKRKEYLTGDQIKIFCKVIEGHPYEPYYLMMLSSMRVREALNVKDEDITDEGIFVHGTKTEASDRFIPFMFPRLKEVIYNRPSVSVSALYRTLKKICQENDLPELTNHSLRISFASACYSKGVPERVAMKIGGWSSLQTMHNVYIRISEDDVKKYADILQDAFH